MPSQTADRHEDSSGPEETGSLHLKPVDPSSAASALPLATETSTCFSFLRICSGECAVLSTSSHFKKRLASNLLAGTVAGRIGWCLRCGRESGS